MGSVLWFDGVAAWLPHCSVKEDQYLFSTLVAGKELVDPVRLSLPSPNFQITLWCILEIEDNCLWFLTCPCSLGTILNFWVFLYEYHWQSWSSALQNSLIVTSQAAVVGCFSASVSHVPASTWSTWGAKIVFQFECALCTTELATLPHPYDRKWFARLHIVELMYLFLLLCCNSEGAQPSWAATTSPLPAREAIHCVSFNNYCVAEVVSAVPQLPCSGTKLIFLGSFTKQVLEDHSTIKISATVTCVDGLGTEAKGWEGLEAEVEDKLPEEWWVWRANYIDRICV